MEHRLLLFNPSNDRRTGHVATAWQPIEQAIGIPGEQVQVYDDGVEIPSQVDRIDPCDRRLDTLSFSLRKELGPGPENYSRESGSVFLTESEAPRVSAEQTPSPPGLPRIELMNDKVAVSVSLQPSQGKDAGCFGGAAQSFRIRGEAARHLGRCEIEMLDFWQSIGGFLEHDPEKRCIQVDRLTIPNPPWSGREAEEVELFKLSYEVVSYCTGPVRQSCTIASAPFEYARPDPFRERIVPMECRFYRTLILYHDADYLLEELWLRGKDPEHGEAWLDLRFAAHYFAEMDMGPEPTIHWSKWVPDWFAISYPWGFGCPGYGFATDVHSGQPQWPHPGYPLAACANRAFSWELHACMRALCLHRFQIDAAESTEHQAGQAWYEQVYKPTRAQFQ